MEKQLLKIGWNMHSKLLNQEVLTEEEALDLMRLIASGELPESELAAILTAYRLRAISVPELLGFRTGILELAVRPEITTKDLIDVCGTGGDGKDTFNISTLTALVLASLDVPVAKHGNNAFSSKCGSSNVLEALGIRLTSDSKILEKCLAKTNICFLHAPLFHPSLKNVAAVRKQLGFRTIFNLLGPLVNPLETKYQLTGVANIATLNLYQQALAEINNDYAIVHSYDGYDEISLTGKFIVISKNFTMEVFPEELGVKSVTADSLVGGQSIADSTGIFKEIIRGNATLSQKSAISANVATALKLKNTGIRWEDAYQQATGILNSNKLEYLVNDLVKITNGN